MRRFQKLWDQNCNKKSYGTKLRPLTKLWDQNCNKKSYGTKSAVKPTIKIGQRILEQVKC